jgi:hypothetical protein
MIAMRFGINQLDMIYFPMTQIYNMEASVGLMVPLADLTCEAFQLLAPK